MTGYTKLFGSIVLSTIWNEDHTTRIVWITLLALRNKNNIAEGSIPGLAVAARVSVEECQIAIQKLMSPDPHSRSKEFDGRRIQEVEGGWLILNGEKYRQKMNEDERRAYFAQKQREYREKHPKKRVKKVSTNVKDSERHVKDSERQSLTVNDVNTVIVHRHRHSTESENNTEGAPPKEICCS